MRVGRTQDHISLCLTQDEYATFLRQGVSHHDRRLRLTCKVDRANDELIVTFGSGRVLSLNGGSWRVQLDPSECGGSSISEFGLTPTTFNWDGSRRIRIKIPEVRSPLKKRLTAKFETPVLSRRFSPKLPERQARDDGVTQSARYVTDEEMLMARDIYNRAIDRGFVPALDAKGHIIFFQRKIG